MLRRSMSSGSANDDRPGERSRLMIGASRSRSTRVQPLAVVDAGDARARPQDDRRGRDRPGQRAHARLVDAGHLQHARVPQLRLVAQHAPAGAGPRPGWRGGGARPRPGSPGRPSARPASGPLPDRPARGGPAPHSGGGIWASVSSRRPIPRHGDTTVAGTQGPGQGRTVGYLERRVWPRFRFCARVRLRRLAVRWACRDKADRDAA